MTENSVFGPVPMYVTEWLARCTDVRSLLDEFDREEAGETGLIAEWVFKRNGSEGMLALSQGLQHTQAGETLTLMMRLDVAPQEHEYQARADWVLWRAGEWLVGASLYKSSPSEYEVIAKVPTASITSGEALDRLYQQVVEGRNHIQATYDAYLAEYEAQKLDYARQYVRALEGDAHAQYKIGIALQRGEGVPRNDAKSAEWIKNAANQGCHEAMLEVAKDIHGRHETEGNKAFAICKAILADENASENCRNNAQHLLNLLKIFSEEGV